MLKLFSFKKPEKREFGYQPRYYNPEKEALQEKIRRASGRGNGTYQATQIKSNISRQFQLARNREKKFARGNWVGTSSLRLVSVLVGLMALAYLVLSKYLPMFMNNFFPESGL